MRQFILAALLAFIALPGNAAERWETLPPTPAPIPTDRSGDAEANGIKIHYAIYGQGSSCTAASRILIIGEIRFRPSRRITL